MHPCGCYHQFFPRELPRAAEGERPLLRIESATHYIAGVDLAKGEASPVRYSLRPYDRLRSLPAPDGGRRHFDDADLIERRFDIEGIEREVAK